MTTTRSSLRRRLFSVRPGSVVAVCALGIQSVFAQGQPTTPTTAATDDDAPVVLEELVVNTVRGSLVSAQEIKQNATQFVDSIVAEDIGKLPDNSVADALQHLPGIQVGRGNGEVSTVLIRGLPNLGTTVNGNEIFTGTSRGVALQDIPAELVAGVDVYKSTSPDKVEGGIAGLIDIRLRRPFDFDKPKFAAGARLIYGENADKTGFVGSMLLSNRWKAGEGEVGLLYSGAYQQRYFVDQTAFNFLFEPVGVPTTIHSTGTLELPFTQGSLIIPGDRSRYANSVAFQWKISEGLEVYNDFLNTAYRNKHQVHFLIGFPRFGAFTAATVNPNSNIPITTTSENNFHLTSTQAFENSTDGYNNVFGVKWGSGATRIKAEYLYNWNKVDNQVLIVDTRWAPPSPGTFTFTYNDGGKANLAITNADVAADNYFLWGLFDNRDYSSSEQNGFKVEVDHTISDGFFTNLAGGVIWTDRSAKFRGTSRNDIAPAGATNGDRFAPTVPRTSTITGFGSVNPDGPLSYYSTPHWFGASPDYLYENPDSVRALFGLPPGPAGFNPTLGFTDDESVIAGFINARFSTSLGDNPFDGAIGFRVADTSQDLQGYRSDETPIDSSKSQTDFLPVINSRLKLSDKTQMRLAIGSTITRPNFNDLNPAVTLNAPTTTGGAAGTGSGGNPDLETVKSTNYDLSWEYYFDEASYFAVTAFYRSIDGYVQSFAATETIGGINYNVVRPRNSGKGHLNGLEFAYQQFPEALKGFGWMANYTYIDGETDAPDTSPGAPVGARVTKPYAQVSEHSYNIILVYERGKFSSRLAYNWRGEFTDTFDGPNAPGSPLRQIIVKPTDTMDFSCSYALDERFTITLDATNILDYEYQDYFADADLYPRDTRAYDRTVSLGVRVRF